jgi:hypothetical protein
MNNKGVIRNRYSKEQTIQWPKKKEKNDKRQTIAHNTLNRKIKDD